MGRRWIWVTTVVLVVLAGLFVAVDRIALGYAQSQAADRIRRSQNLTAEPEVSVKGFPFLTQVAGRRLDEVTISATDVETEGRTAGVDGRLRIARLDADLRGVRLSGGYDRAVASSATGTAVLTYADLSAGAPAGVSVAYGGPGPKGAGEVRVTGTLVLPGLGPVRRSVVSDLAVSGGDTVRLHAREIPGAGTIPGLEPLVRSKIDFAGRLSGLPDGLRLVSVRATPAGVSISLSGRDVSLTG